MDPLVTGEPSAVRMSLRAECPDGTALEFVREDDGRIVRMRAGANGVVLDRVVARPDESGACEVVAVDDTGASVGLVTPDTVERHTNPFGLFVERATYGEGLAVEQSFDDDGRIREVTLRGPWGEQTTALRPDGSRTVRWRTPLQEGEETWDSSGQRRSSEVTCADGTTHRWSAPARPPRPGHAGESTGTP